MAELLYMLPAVAKEHPIRGVERNAKFLCQSSMADVAGRISVANGAHKRVCKYGIAATLSAYGAAFVDAISHVVNVGPDEQVRRIDAGPNVAMVKHLHSSWDWSMRQFPCEAVRLDVPPASIGAAAYNKSTIAAPSIAGGPQPTARHWFRFGLAPETFHGRQD